MLCFVFNGSVAAHEIEAPIRIGFERFIKSDCRDNKVKPITETIVKPARIIQTTKTASLKIQNAHTLKTIHTPNYIWVKVSPPTGVKAGYVPEPIPVYETKFIPGAYEWQDAGVFELQAASFDIIRDPYNIERKRTIMPVMAVERKWVETLPGRVETVLTGYVQPPPALAGHKLVNNTPAVGIERSIPAIYKTQNIVIGQTREPAIIQQGYGACQVRPNKETILE